MAVIRLINKNMELVKEEDVPHDRNSLEPLPRKILHDNIQYTYSHKEGVTNVYKADY